MRYDVSKLSLPDLFAPVATATAALTRLDERIARSPIGDGWVQRAHFADACASLWVDGELVHLEDLVLHDVGMGIRAPSHELTIAQDVLRSRRSIFSHPPGWALSADGLAKLRGRGIEELAKSAAATFAVEDEPFSDEADGLDDPFDLNFAEIDAVLARSEALLSDARERTPSGARERDAFVYEPDWNEDERLAEWRVARSQAEGLPAVLRAAVLLDAWNMLQVLQHAPWLGRLLAASLLREAGVTPAHLAPVNLGLKQISRERRASRDRDTRLLAILDGLTAGAEAGLKEHDRLLLARQQMQHRISGRRISSKLPQLIDLVLAKPMVSAGMIASELGVTPQGALKIAGELNLRELTGRDRFRAWGVL
ncbi:DUF1612 and helix-turn-helix domain-containing protein [Rhizobium sp. XQZ8]|uniref:RHE_PE00001 family protein n=1 Tax=Rhizobium populisoli TaxID=2859785 RepID=UPI001C663274|nr:RHE_PE00001 family protein [Rhizobium populisoli]MBW6422312.1 DUF1612 and helix-turn-helix domain-containing protein [Rhizobium populisoli]